MKSKSAVPSGHHFFSMQFTPTGAPDFAKGKGSPGIVKLLVDGKEIGAGELSVTSPNRLAQGGAMLVGADTGAAMLRHAGEEAGLVIRGELEVTVGAEVRILRPGEAYFFESRIPHRFRNVGKEVCIVVAANTPPSL